MIKPVESRATLKKIAKYCIFGLLYSFLLFEITYTSGLLDPRCSFWPSTGGQITYMFTGGRFFACYGYQYQVRGKMMQGSQLLPLAYKDNLKQMQIIRVHYDSSNPEKSCFEPGFNAVVTFAVLFVALLGILLLSIPVLSWISTQQKKHSQELPEKDSQQLAQSDQKLAQSDQKLAQSDQKLPEHDQRLLDTLN